MEAANSAANSEAKKFEPIEYDEELNFSLQTPKHLEKEYDDAGLL